MGVCKTFRAVWRITRLGLLFLIAYADFFLRVRLRGRAHLLPERARWMQGWARRFARIVHLEVRFEGRPPATGILASNHLSYLDIIVYGSIQPMIFLSKSEVASWPVIGGLTRNAGTLYVVRQQKGDVARLPDEMARVIDAGVPLVVFLEGTSSDGAGVLPFRSSLLAPAEEHRWPATGAWIHYTLEDGSVADEVCYWRDMTFGPHLFNLLSKRRVGALVRFGTPIRAGLDRKEMARELHAQVCGLKDAQAGVVPATTGNH